MKHISLCLFVLLSTISLTAQQLPEWNRVHTFDESVIEMNTSLVTFISKDVSRVRFRWNFDQPQPLGGKSQLKYKSVLEVMEFNCSERRYRPYHFTYFDEDGSVVRIEEMNLPGEWRVTSGMMEKLRAPACQLVQRITYPPIAAEDKLRLERLGSLVLSFAERLEQIRDFKPLIDSYFAADYLKGYLNDRHTNWFLNLDRAVAAKASRAELQRFYVAQLNSGYLSAVYFISQHRHAAEGIPEEKLIPSDITDLIDNHPYSAKYKTKSGNYDFLGERIVSVEQFRGYTDLLEGIAILMRRHVANGGAEKSHAYQKLLRDSGLYSPTERVCANDCLGLPKGTRLFRVNVPMFQLQLAEIKGKLKVVSAVDFSHATGF